jgi:myo-inositol-1(or 4)-monophosphatase
VKNTLLECVQAAGRVVRERFGRAGEVRRKENQSSIVTESDLAAERCILDVIGRRHPQHNILAEESGHLDQGSEFTWVVDPLDGTSNFAAGLPWFGVMVAVLRGPEPILGAMLLPLADTLYLAEAGQGSWRNGERVRVTTATDLGNLLCAYGMDGSADEEETRRQVGLLGLLLNRVRNVRATNCLLDFAYTLDGRFGVCLNHATRLWDIAAGWLLFREAGGVMADLHGRNLRFDLGPGACARNYAVLGGSPALVGQVAAVVHNSGLFPE